MSVFRISKIVQIMSKRTQTKFYAVRVGRTTGIFDKWSKCNAQVSGFKGSEFKAFTSREEAQDYLKSGNPGEKRKLEQVLSASSELERPLKQQKTQRIVIEQSDNDTQKIAVITDSSEVHITASNSSRISVETNGSETKIIKENANSPPESIDNTNTNNSDHVDMSGHQSHGQTTPNEVTVVAYIDGACLNNGTNHARGGYGVFFGPNDKRNISKRLEGTKQTNQRAEITAAIAALKQIESGKPVELRTDSHYVMKAMTEWMAGWKKDGFKKKIENLDLFHILDAEITNRKGKVTWTYVPAHTGILGNEKADELAKKGIYAPK